MASLRDVVLHSVPTDSDCDSFDILYNRVEAAVRTVAGDRTPGYPLNLRFGSNAQALEHEKTSIVLCAVARLHMWLDPDIPFEEMVDSGLPLIFTGLHSPYAVFIKDEPHPLRKVVLERYRCISPGDLVDLLVETVLFKESAEVLKGEQLFTSGSAVGIGFNQERCSGFVNFINKTNAELGYPIADDMSGFDALHTPETLLNTAEVDRRSHSHVNGSLDRWNMANRRWCVLCANSTSVISGNLYVKVTPGMLNSGSRDTSRRNTTLRLVYSTYLSLASGNKSVFPLANGDDGITWGVKDLERYKRCAYSAGLPVRDVMRSRGDVIEFCSHEFNLKDRSCVLLSWPKALYRILTAPDLHVEDAYQVLQEFYGGPVFDKTTRFITAIRLPSRSDVALGLC